jgi:hypothetical protein
MGWASRLVLESRRVWRLLFGRAERGVDWRCVGNAKVPNSRFVFRSIRSSLSGDCIKSSTDTCLLLGLNFRRVGA